MSHSGHKRVLCKDCGAVLFQCRCFGPKREEYHSPPSWHRCIRPEDMERDIEVRRAADNPVIGVVPGMFSQDRPGAFTDPCPHLFPPGALDPPCDRCGVRRSSLIETVSLDRDALTPEMAEEIAQANEADLEPTPALVDLMGMPRIIERGYLRCDHLFPPDVGDPPCDRCGILLSELKKQLEDGVPYRDTGPEVVVGGTAAVSEAGRRLVASAHATEAGILQEDDRQEHRQGEEGRETEEAGRGDRAEQREKVGQEGGEAVEGAEAEEMTRPTVPEVLPLVAALYERHSVGCCLHLALDDGNLETDDLEFCLKQALQKGHQDCSLLARLMLRMTMTQRRKLEAQSMGF